MKPEHCNGIRVINNCAGIQFKVVVSSKPQIKIIERVLTHSEHFCELEVFTGFYVIHVEPVFSYFMNN